ncbi:MAG: DUF1653 domain-containing protein [Alphaproteobacteria bacterium]|nr:DUF1653 domain-containing protein [Alphaproteobacteria bacterium]
MVKVGAKYKHYKGNIYEVIAMGVHTETKEGLVIYRATYGTACLNDKYAADTVWVRPATMWNELVDGIPRFQEI